MNNRHPFYEEPALLDKPEPLGLAHMTARIALVAFWLGVGALAIYWLH